MYKQVYLVIFFVSLNLPHKKQKDNYMFCKFSVAMKGITINKLVEMTQTLYKGS